MQFSRRKLQEVKGIMKFVGLLCALMLQASVSLADGNELSLIAVREGLEAFRSETGLLYTKLDEKSFLSETVGLEMLCHVAFGDEKAFDLQVELVERHFLSETGLLYWKLDENLVPAERSNASIDDLRVCRALLEGYEKWGSRRYLDLALRIGRALRRHCMVGDVLVDGTSWSARGRIFGNFEYLTLSYGDLGAIALLSEFDDSWSKVYGKTLDTLRRGLGAKAPPYWGYDPTSGRYDRKGNNQINLIMHPLYLAEVGVLEEAYMQSLEAYFRKRRPADTNIAALSLWAGLLHEMGRRAEARRVIGEAGRYRLNLPAPGAVLGYRDNGPGFSSWVFDNLVCLLMMTRVFSESGSGACEGFRGGSLCCMPRSMPTGFTFLVRGSLSSWQFSGPGCSFKVPTRMKVRYLPCFPWPACSRASFSGERSGSCSPEFAWRLSSSTGFFGGF